MVELFTVKPLQWQREGEYRWRSVSMLGFYMVSQLEDGQWGYVTLTDARQLCDSLEHGKQLCNEHWRSSHGIGQFLERFAVPKLDRQ